MGNTNNKVDVIVVGAGPAGLACAYTLARQGVEVIVLERGSFSGAKNMFGGIFFTSILEKLFSDLIAVAPWERYVAKRRISLLAKDGETALDFRPGVFSQVPFNHSFIVKRAQMDQWFAKQVEAAGASIIYEYCVKDFLWDGPKVVGICSGGEEDSLMADVVVCAEGANSLLAEKSGLRSRLQPEMRSIAIKENIRLPREVIEDRFGLSDRQGAAYEFFGDAVDGMLGNGFIYTNMESLSVGVGFSIDDFIQNANGREPNDMLEEFKNHPAIAPFLREGEVAEYMTHMIPCENFKKMPKVYRDGLLLAGDAAGFVNNSFLHEGVNLAMASGLFAAETILEAKAAKDFSARVLAGYKKRLEHSFVLQDLKTSRNFIPFVSARPWILKEYPDVLSEVLADYFSVSEKPKKVVKQEIIAKVRKKIGMGRLAADFLGVIKNLI